MRFLYPFIFLTFLFSLALKSQTADAYAVQAEALIQESPPQITLRWKADPGAQSYLIYRKLKADNFWGFGYGFAQAADTQFIDTAVFAGISYEYKIQKNGTGYSGFGYVNAGIRFEYPEETRYLLLIVDSTYSQNLSPEIERLEKDLEGDGYQVIRHDVGRQSPVDSVHNLIQTAWLAHPAQTHTVLLLGHVPVPYSGNIAPDGHVPDHLGAWPCDAYYGEMNGNWTDVNVNNTGASNPRNHNLPGDGKFDQSTLPSEPELEVGRVDFADMPAFTQGEEELLRAYLNKDHAWRNKQFTVQKRALIDDNFGGFSGEAFAAVGWKNFSTMVGRSAVAAGDYFPDLSAGSYLWSYGCGGGSYTTCAGVGTTNDFVSDSVQSVFSVLFGSYFGDWDSQNNLLRASLASGTTLTNAWGGRPHWQFHHMALGETVGYSTRLTQYNNSMYHYNLSPRSVHIALMGDPTLKAYIVAPSSAITATFDQDRILVNWAASAEATEGYHLYRKNDTMPSFSRLNAFPLTDTFYADTLLPVDGLYTYMVRAIKLEQTPGGSFFNLSQGVCDTAWNPGFVTGLGAGDLAEYGEQRDHSEWMVWPNPVGDNKKVFLRSTGAEKDPGKIKNMELFDLKGQKIRSYGPAYEKDLLSTGDGSMELDLGDLQAGLYLLRLKENDRFQTFKILVD